MSRWKAQDKEAYRTEVMQRITAVMPSVMQEYGSINWEEELKGSMLTPIAVNTLSTLLFKNLG